MVLNKKVITKILCAVMGVVGVAMLVPIGVSLIYKETDIALCFAYTAIPVITISFLGIKYLPKQDNSVIRMRDGFFIVASTWIVMSIIGAIPFVISGAIPNPFDAFFETVSGFTTTGSTILTEIESLPRGILFWRSFTHWLGGMGVLVLTIALLPMLGIGGQKIMRAETTGPTMDKISTTINNGAKGLYIIYTAFTLLEVVILALLGMNLFDAFTHSFGTLGTGGFSPYNASIGAFNNVPIEVVISIFMVLAGVNFNLYYAAIYSKKGLSAFKDTEFKVYISIVCGAVVFVGVILTLTNTYSGFWQSMRYSLFQVTSIMSSTGYATTDFDVWPPVCKLVIIMLMFIGASAGSTAGGLKVIRVIMMGKLVKKNIQTKLSPRAISTVKLDGKEVGEDTLNGVAAFMGIYAALLFAGTFVISLTGVDNTTAFTSILTCLSNIGPGFNLIGPTCNFHFYPWFIKVMLAIYMIAGRLEIFTIVLMFTKDFWDKNK